MDSKSWPNTVLKRNAKNETVEEAPQPNCSKDWNVLFDSRKSPDRCIRIPHSVSDHSVLASSPCQWSDPDIVAFSDATLEALTRALEANPLGLDPDGYQRF